MPITKTVSRWTGLRRRAWDDGVTLRLSGGGPVGLDFNSSTGGVEIGYRF